MPKQAIVPANAPAPIAPYSPAIACPAGAHLVFISGQVAIDPATQQFLGGDVAAQTHQVMRNLLAVVQAAGGSADDLVKLTIFLRDMADFGVVNEIYASYLRQPYPARATVQVSKLPRDGAVEIDAVAAIG